MFACFNKDGEWQGDQNYRIVHFDGKVEGDWPFIDTNDIPVGAVSVPVVLDDNGKEYEAMMNAGQFTYSVKGDNLDTIQPRNDWCFAIKSETSKKQKILPIKKFKKILIENNEEQEVVELKRKVEEKGQKTA